MLRKYARICPKNGIESEILLKQGEILSVLTKIKDEQDIFVLGNSLNSGRSENLLNIIKELKAPIFVVSENFSNDKSAEFNKNSSICVCFDGSAQSKEILSIVSKNFPNNKKFILNLSTLKKPSEEIFSKISHLKNDKNSEFIALYGKNDEILKFIKRENIGLVACGAFGGSGIKRLFFGSFSKFLLKNAKIPILIIS